MIGSGAGHYHVSPLITLGYDAVISQAKRLLDQGYSANRAAIMLGIGRTTIRKIVAGKLKPPRHDTPPANKQPTILQLLGNKQLQNDFTWSQRNSSWRCNGCGILVKKKFCLKCETAIRKEQDRKNGRVATQEAKPCPITFDPPPLTPEDI